MRKTILSVDHIEARKFLLDETSYTTLDLPPYFTFQKLLTDLSTKLKGGILEEDKILAAKKHEDVNHILYGNKDGKYEWRKYEIINPLLYVSLVNAFTEKNNWELVQKRFINLQSGGSIRCISIPVLPDDRQSQKATQISEWIDMVEKESIRLALNFEYLYQTDISDCYGSIYTHSISWALHDKATSKANRGYTDLLGNTVDQHLQAMSHGQTNGIPQGSVLMDLVAETLLAFADYELYVNIKDKISEDDYFILRYRDDYRIFVREPSQGEIIMKALSEVLIGLGLRLNTSKTKRSDEIIINSIKPDKLSILDKPLSTKLNKQDLRRELLLIYILGTEYPNSGTIKTRLTRLYSIANDEHYKYQKEELLSILVNISFDSPNSFPLVAAFISKIISSQDNDAKTSTMDKILRKLNLLPNSGLLEIWLQRITLPNALNYKFNEKVCNKVVDKKVELYQTSWITDEFIKEMIKSAVYVNENVLKNIDPVISSKEIQLFAAKY